MTQRLTINDAQIASILATMVEHLGRMADPSYGKKLREDVMTLPADLQKAQADAQDLIAKGNTLKAEIKKQQDAANEQLESREKAVKVREATMEQINERKKEAEDAEARAKAIKEENKKKEDNLAAIAASHAVKDSAYVKTKADLDKYKKDLDEYKAKLDIREGEIKAYETEINETAAQVTGLIKTKMRR